MRSSAPSATGRRRGRARWLLVIAIGLAPVVGWAQRGGAPALPATAPAGVTLPPETPPQRVAAVSGDVPPIPKAPPPRFAVAPFENHSNGETLQWMVAGTPMELAEKSERALPLAPAHGSLIVGAPILPNERGVAQLAQARGADLVVTGWVERPNQQLRLVAQLWKRDGAGVAKVAQAERLFARERYHAALGEVLFDLWTEAGWKPGEAERAIFVDDPGVDDYAVQLLGRGLGLLSGALGPVDLKAAERDLTKAVLIAPKFAEAQRVVGELLLAQAQGDPRVLARAAGKFAYANDLRADYVPAMAAAAAAAAAAGKREVAATLYRRLVTLRPWDLELRYQLGQALWEHGEESLAQRELTRVLEREPSHLPARRILALVHAARGDTASLVRELEAIATQAPEDLAVRLELASAYAAGGQWRQAEDALIEVSTKRPLDVPLLVRIGDAVRLRGDLDGALQWYQRAMRTAPELPAPAFAHAQALLDAGRLDDAVRAYTGLQRFRGELGATLLALGALAMLRHQPDEAAWYLRRAVREAPRSLLVRQSTAAAELARRDARAALLQLEPALRGWPEDATLHYLLGLARALLRERGAARAALTRAIELDGRLDVARAALASVDLGGEPAVEFTPKVERPWGDAAALTAAVETFDRAQRELLATRARFQAAVVDVLAALGQGPLATGRARGLPRRCPLRTVAPPWHAAQERLAQVQRRGAELEEAYRYLARHDEAGYAAGLLPTARSRLAAAQRAYKIAVADLGELRAEWQRGVVAELRRARCTDPLLAAAFADPRRYPSEDAPAGPAPRAAPPRPPRRAMFYVDNTRCPVGATVWVDGELVGAAEAGKRSAFVAEAGERALCLTLPDSASCGDRGTVRQVYLHEEWTLTMDCSSAPASSVGPGAVEPAAVEPAAAGPGPDAGPR